MSAATDLAVLVILQTKAFILQKLYDACGAVGLDVETFESGDPTRSELYAVATQFETYEQRSVDAINGGYGDTATGAWLSIWAASERDTPREAATYATCTYRLVSTNPSPFILDPDDLTVSSSITGKTYRNTGTTPTDSTIGPRTLLGNGTLDLIVQAEEGGSASSAAIGEIDSIDSPSMSNVSGSNTTPALGVDEEKDPALRKRAQAKLGSLSPNGPKDAYHYVATTRTLNGGVDCTDTRVLYDSTTGDVTVYLRGSAGAVTADTRDAVEEALETYATPNVVDLTVVSATNLVVPVTYQVWVYGSINKTVTEIRQLVSDALLEAIASRPIGGDIIPPSPTGTLYRGYLEATILRAVTLRAADGSVTPFGFRCTVTLPAGDVAMAINEVAVLGALTGTVTLVEGP